MDLLDCLGQTPLIRLDRLSPPAGGTVFIKLEMRNPGGSIKDRAARAYLENALKRGQLAPGGCVIEATSGNLGIGLAVICARLGLRLILTMPASVSTERRILLSGLGAEVNLTPAEQGMTGAQNKAAELVASIPGAFRPNQFENPDGPEAHYRTTGPEILTSAAKEGFSIDAFVAGVGSGATISGVARCLREKYPTVHIAAVEPAESPVLSQGKAGPHGIQGIGANFVPAVFDRSLTDEIITVSTEAAIATARRLLTQEAVNAGISSGANVHAALMLASRPEFKGANIVTIACDTGERYLSTALFAEA